MSRENNSFRAKTNAVMRSIDSTSCRVKFEALRESLADKERELLARERLEEQLEYDRRLQQRRVEEDVRRQTELNVRRQLEQERLYRRQKDRLEQFATSYFRTAR